MSNAKDIFYIFYPIYTVAKYTGFVGYSIEGPPKRRYLHPSKWYTRITNTFHCTLAFALVWCYFGVFLKYEVPYIILYLALYLAVVMRSVQYIIHVVTKNVYNQDIIQILKDLDYLDQEFNRLGIALPYTRLKIITLLVLGITSVVDATYNGVVISNILADEKMILVRNVWNYSRIYVNLSQTIFDLIFFVIILIAKNMLQNLHILMFKKFSNCNNSVPLTSSDISSLKDMMKYYGDLTSIVTKFSRIMSPQILLLIGTHFIYGATQLLIFIQEFLIHGFNWLFVRNFLGVCGTALLKMGLLIGVSNECQRQVRAQYI